MKLLRRQFLQLASSAAAVPALPRRAAAQAYPAHPVRILVGGPAGGTLDILARLFGQWLSARLGQPFVIENRPGGGGNIAAEAVVRAPADGYTLLTIGAPNAINTTLYDKLRFNFIRDIAPIASLIRFANVLEVHPSVPVKLVSEFITYAKANPGKINMASAGIGSGQHISGEMFKLMTGVNMIHVPYRGSAQALTDLVGGRVQVMFDALPNSIEYIRAGTLRALAVTTATRSELLPDLPTVGDFVPGYEASAVDGIGAPAGTPAPIIDRLNNEINAGLADPKLRARLIDMGATILAGSPSDYAKLIAEGTEKWGKVIRAANIKPG